MVPSAVTTDGVDDDSSKSGEREPGEELSLATPNPVSARTPTSVERLIRADEPSAHRYLQAIADAPERVAEGVPYGACYEPAMGQVKELSTMLP